MSEGVGLVIGAFIVWIDFLMPFNSSTEAAAKRHPCFCPAAEKISRQDHL